VFLVLILAEVSRSGILKTAFLEVLEKGLLQICVKTGNRRDKKKIDLGPLNMLE
jgi:hypothetical protein